LAIEVKLNWKRQILQPSNRNELAAWARMDVRSGMPPFIGNSMGD
jgi:hypothetical protein